MAVARSSAVSLTKLPSPARHSNPDSLRQPDGATKGAGTGGDTPTAPVFPSGRPQPCKRRAASGGGTAALPADRCRSGRAPPTSKAKGGGGAVSRRRRLPTVMSSTQTRPSRKPATVALARKRPPEDWIPLSVSPSCPRSHQLGYSPPRASRPPADRTPAWHM